MRKVVSVNEERFAGWKFTLGPKLGARALDRGPGVRAVGLRYVSALWTMKDVVRMASRQAAQNAVDARRPIESSQIQTSADPPTRQPLGTKTVGEKWQVQHPQASIMGQKPR